MQSPHSSHSSCLSPTWLVVASFARVLNWLLSTTTIQLQQKFMWSWWSQVKTFRFCRGPNRPRAQISNRRRLTIAPDIKYKVGNLRFKGRSKFPTCFQICPLTFALEQSAQVILQEPLM